MGWIFSASSKTIVSNCYKLIHVQDPKQGFQSGPPNSFEEVIICSKSNNSFVFVKEVIDCGEGSGDLGR